MRRPKPAIPGCPCVPISDVDGGVEKVNASCVLPCLESGPTLVPIMPELGSDPGAPMVNGSTNVIRG